jgi:outer membrane protein assembly factor BamB
MSKQRQFILSLDRRTGMPRWETQISQGGFPAQNHPKNTEATPTVASDGQRLFATFFHHEKIQLTALSPDGKILWQQDLGPFNPQRYKYGYAPSPLIYRNLVIVAAEHDGESFITARDRQTGAQIWRTPRPSNITFSSPVVAHVASRDQLLLSGSEMVASYDPVDGRQLWTAPGTTAATCGTMVWEGDLVVASGGYPKAETLAVRADGSGTVLWTNPQKCYEQSMLAYQGHVYALTDNGVMYCWRINDGKEMWKHRLKGPVSSSPVLAGGHIYWANEEGTWYVFKPNPSRFELVAENKLLDEAFASPAAVANIEDGASGASTSATDGRLFIRTATGTGAARKEFLFCIGK